MGDGLTDVTLAYDDGPGRGLGHRRRMEALAQALRQQGATTATLPVENVTAADVLVVDAYSVRSERPTFDARVLAAIDDLERDLAVDLLVDPNPDPANAPTHAGRALCGVAYALVGPAPASLPDNGNGLVLITTGGGDDGGTGARVAEALHVARADLEMRLVVGPWAERRTPRGVTTVECPDGLWDELARADVVVTAGGVTMIEACLLGRATVAIALADNQRRAVQGGVAFGAVVAAPADRPDEIARAALSLLDDSAGRRAQGERASLWIDGQGPRRVAEALLALA